VVIHYSDGRFFLDRSKDRYDLIFVGLSSPRELQTNRLFSREFFMIAEEKLHPEGILALTLPGSLTYISDELRDLNGCIMSTLKDVYRYVRIIPGETNLYFASNSNALMTTGPQELGRRLHDRSIETRLFTPAYIEFRLHQQWLSWFNRSMDPKRFQLNSDFHPRAVFHAANYSNAKISPYLVSVFRWMERITFRGAAVLATVVTVVLTVIVVLRRRSVLTLAYAVTTSGFASMIFDLGIIFAFQSLYGYLYYQIGLLVTAFMVGVAAGGYLITRRLDRIRNGIPILMAVELCLACFSLLLPFVFVVPAAHLNSDFAYAVLYGLFLAMSLLSGILIGIEFPLATGIYLGSPVSKGLKTGRRKQILGHAAGLFYAADLLGGYFGGLIGGILLLPILGLKNSCFLLAVVKGGSALIVMIQTRLSRE
jgi:spermidine synthase